MSDEHIRYMGGKKGKEVGKMESRFWSGLVRMRTVLKTIRWLAKSPQTLKVESIQGYHIRRNVGVDVG